MIRCLLVLLLLAGCHAPRTATSVAQGHVTDADGTQNRDGLGGSGTVAAATEVRAFAVNDDGTLADLGASAAIQSGAYAIEVPSGMEKIVLQARDANGNALASAILESTGNPDDTITVTPMDTESSVEMQVFVQMVAKGTPPGQIDPIDLRLRLDAATAADVRDGGGSDDVAALAEAVATAQATELGAWAQRGLDTTEEDAFQAELTAAQSLDSLLDTGGDDAQAYASFESELDTAVATLGTLSASDRAEAYAQADLAFRAVVRARLGDTATTRDAAHAAAGLEATSEPAALDDLFATAGAPTATVDTLDAAASTLQSDVAAATSTGDLAQAWATFDATLVGDTTSDGSALGDVLGIVGTSAPPLDATLASADGAAATLDASVLATAAASQPPAAAGQAIANAWGTYRSAVEAAVYAGDSGVPAADADFGAEVIVLASGSFLPAS